MQPQLGERIKQARLMLGLSQQRLAGTEISAAFISMIENGRAIPSPAKLQLIAKRLQKPVEYFSADFSDQEETAHLLFESALQARNQGDLVKAKKRLLQALRLAEQTQNLVLQARIQLAAASCLTAMEQGEEALDRCETAVDLLRTTGKDGIADLVEALFQLGGAQFVLEDYGAAKRTYTRVVRMTAGLKTRAEIAFRAQCYLASCLGRLGDTDGSLEVLQAVACDCDAGAYPGTWLEVALGLSAAYFKKGIMEDALSWARKAVTACKNNGSDALVLAEHNMAVIESRRGNWEKAYVLMKRCLTAYGEAGRYPNAPSILEEMARYWRHKNDLDKAEQCCREALELLEMKDSTVQRGRTYCLLAEISQARNNHARAYELFEISREFFRKACAKEEMERVALIIEKLKQQL